MTPAQRTRPAAELIPPGVLHTALDGAVSLAAVLRRLGLAETSTQRRRLQRSIAAAGLSATHLLGQAHYRGRSSPQRLPAESVLRRTEPGSARTKRYLLRRALDESGVPYRCRGCGNDGTWRGRPLTLEIDHINGDRLDNRRENLRYLCPSCHSQTATFARPAPADQ